MSLMEKFSAVEIKADNRISADDKAFCLRQQEAFDKAGPALQKVAEAMAAAKAEQAGILTADEDFIDRYVGGDCDVDGVYDTMKKRNRTFISTVVNYFSRKYSVELDEHEIEKHLIPTGPKEPNLPWGGYRSMSEDEIASYRQVLDAYKVEKDKFEQSLRTLPLRYEQVVDEIFVQLGGFSFQERAMNEFLRLCWDTSHHRNWRSDQYEEEFEIKNDVLRLTGSWVYCDENKWMSNPVPEYKPSQSLTTILDALVHYEVGKFKGGAQWFPELFKYDTQENQFEIAYMSKIKNIKLFKNGRVDIKFRSAAFVQEFVEQYLRRNPA